MTREQMAVVREQMAACREMADAAGCPMMDGHMMEGEMGKRHMKESTAKELKSGNCESICKTVVIFFPSPTLTAEGAV